MIKTRPLQNYPARHGFPRARPAAPTQGQLQLGSLTCRSDPCEMAGYHPEQAQGGDIDLKSTLATLPHAVAAGHVDPGAAALLAEALQLVEVPRWG